MAFLNDRVLDNGLGVFNAECNQLDICTSEPTTYIEATSTYSKGNKSNPSCSVPGAKAGGGREVTIGPITDGNVTGDGTVAFWSLSDTANTRLLAAASLSSSQVVTSGNTFTLTSYKIGIPGPV